MKEKFNLEFLIKSSPRILYNRLYTPAGLSEWFADDVNISKNIYTFFWEGSEQKAELIAKKFNSYVRFHWLDDEEEDTFFEFRISVDEITKGIALILTDFAEIDEQEDAIDLWEQQINDLKSAVGG